MADTARRRRPLHPTEMGYSCLYAPRIVTSSCYRPKEAVISTLDGNRDGNRYPLKLLT